MDHRYIDENSVVERYLDHSLDRETRAAFEAHLVDCQECMDRLLLAEMFHARNGQSARNRQSNVAMPQALPDSPVARVVVYDRRKLAFVAFLGTLLAIPAAYFVWLLLTTPR